MLLGKYYCLIPVTVLCILIVLLATDFPVHDFANYYFGGFFLAEGDFKSWIYFPYEFNKTIAEMGYQQVYGSYAPNTPFLALAFAPFALIPLAEAKMAFNIVSIGLFIFSLGRLYSYYKIKPLYFFMIPVLFFTPLRNNLLFGQVYFLLFFLLTESWLAYEKSKHNKAAFFLSVAILMKVFPALFMFIFLFRKQYKLVAYTAFYSVLLGFFTLIFTGSDIWLFLLQEVLPRASKGEISGVFVDNYQSVFMFLKRVFIFDENLNPDGLNFPLLLHALVFGLKILLLTAGYYLTRNVKDNLWVFCYWIFASIIMTPYGSTYGFVLMLFPYFAVAKSSLSNRKKAVFFIVLAVVNNIPTGILATMLFPFSYLRMFLFIAIFCLFLSPYLKELELKTSIAITALTFLVLTYKNHPSHSQPVLGKNSPLLVYDYSVRSSQLTYHYWDKNGENSATIPINISGRGRALTDLELFKAKKELTFGKSNMRKPMIFENKKVIYLSDYGRGIGFYSIRTLDLNTSSIR